MRHKHSTANVILLISAILFSGYQESKGQSSEQSWPRTLQANEPYRFSDLQSRAVTQENPTGGKGLGGKNRGNGKCRKGAPAFRDVQPGETKVLCDIEGPGMVRHIWMTISDRSPDMLRSLIIRMYWDDSEHPSVIAPFGDFFGVAHGRTAHYMTPWLGTPEGRGFQCYFPMPFSKRCRITAENDSPKQLTWFFYQVDYTLGDRITDDMGRFHAHFRRENPCPVGKDYCLLDTKGSPGVFVGAVIGVNPIGPGWWGEGEMKFYIDGDDEYPTICGTGAEDYLCSGWGMKLHSAIYTGVNYLVKDPGRRGWLDEQHQDRFVSFYRFHVYDPIYFQSDLRVELQQLGVLPMRDFSSAGEWEQTMKKYGWPPRHVNPDSERPGKIMNDWVNDRCDDCCSTVYWYQKPANRPLPAIPKREQRIAGISKQPWEEN